MCLGLGHKTRECRDTNEGRLKVCNKKANEKETCGGYHCGYLHNFFKKPAPVSNFTTVKETVDTINPEPPVEEANT